MGCVSYLLVYSFLHYFHSLYFDYSLSNCYYIVCYKDGMELLCYKHYYMCEFI